MLMQSNVEPRDVRSSRLLLIKRAATNLVGVPGGTVELSFWE